MQVFESLVAASPHCLTAALSSRNLNIIKHRKTNVILTGRHYALHFQSVSLLHVQTLCIHPDKPTIERCRNKCQGSMHKYHSAMKLAQQICLIPWRQHYYKLSERAIVVKSHIMMRRDKCWKTDCS